MGDRIYAEPQKIWDRWTSVRDKLTEQEAKLAEACEHEKLKDVQDNLRAQWEVTKEDLKLAAIIKYLEIEVS